MIPTDAQRATLAARPAAEEAQTTRLTRLLVLHFGELGVDHVAVVLLLLLGRRLLRLALRLRLLLGVHLLAELLRGLRERLRLGIHLGLAFGLQGRLGVRERAL